MTSEAYILVELVHEFNANMKEAMMLKTMHCDTAADVYAWAAVCIRSCVERAFVLNDQYKLSTATDVCPFGEYSYTIMEVL